METCENCGRAIGKLEIPFLYGDNVVCRECHERIKLDAAAPLSYATPAPQHQPPRRVQTVQQTSKIWKGQIILSALVMLAGAVCGITGAQDKAQEHLLGIGILLFAVGFAWYVFARVMAWWHHA